MTTTNDRDAALRRQLRSELTTSHAHTGLERAFADVPRELRGRRVDGQPHTLWRLLEHMRIALWDILEFSRGPEHVSPKWPQGYWPEDLHQAKVHATGEICRRIHPALNITCVAERFKRCNRGGVYRRSRRAKPG